MLQRQLWRSLTRNMSGFQSPPEVILRSCIRQQRFLHTTRCAGSSLPNQYRAAVVTELGKPLSIQTRPLPRNIAKDEVLIEVEAAAINFADVLQAKGEYQVKAQVPYIPGTELCGRVKKVGESVTGVQTGQRVLTLTRPNGAFAEYCTVDGQLLLPAPDHLSVEQAASVLVSYGTAMMALTHTVKVKQGEMVLVTAAAGATGMAIMDIAAHVLGAKVIAVCGGQEKCALAKQRGASFTIDYHNENLREKVKEFTNGKGVNVALDQVGGDTFLLCLKSLANEGRLITVGYASGKIPSVPANLLLLKSSSVHGVFWGASSVTNPPAFFKSIQDTFTALNKRQINPHCGQTFSLDQVNEAFDCVTSRKSTGKVVITMNKS